MFFKNNSVIHQHDGSPSFSKKRKISASIFRLGASSKPSATADAAFHWTLSEDGWTKDDQLSQTKSAASDLQGNDQSTDKPSGVPDTKKRKISNIFRRGTTKSTVAIESRRTWTLTEDEEAAAFAEDSNTHGKQTQFLQPGTSVSVDENSFTLAPSFDELEKNEKEETNNMTKEEFQQQQQNRHKMDLAERDTVIRQLLQMNKKLKSKQCRDIRTLCAVFQKILKEKNQAYREIEMKYTNKINICDNVLMQQEEEVVQIKYEVEQQLQKLEDKETTIKKLEAKYCKELEVYDIVLDSQEEDLLQLKSELEVTNVHLQQASSMLIRSQTKPAP